MKMKLKDKVEVYKRVALNTESMEFGYRNLILYDLAKGMRLKHWHVDGGFELCHPNRKAPLATVK